MCTPLLLMPSLRQDNTNAIFNFLSKTVAQMCQKAIKLQVSDISGIDMRQQEWPWCAYHTQHMWQQFNDSALHCLQSMAACVCIQVLPQQVCMSSNMEQSSLPSLA